MLWDSTGTSDLYNSAIVDPWWWLPVTPLKEITDKITQSVVRTAILKVVLIAPLRVCKG